MHLEHLASLDLHMLTLSEATFPWSPGRDALSARSQPEQASLYTGHAPATGGSSHLHPKGLPAGSVTESRVSLSLQVTAKTPPMNSEQN